MTQAPQKIAILGGGIAGLTTAYELTQDPHWKEKYDITIYQSGWLLGGKCASTRRMDKNARIEECGIHTWFGFYHHAFSMLKQCYQDIKRPKEHPLANCQQAFFEEHCFTVMELEGNDYVPWNIYCPARHTTWQEKPTASSRFLHPHQSITHYLVHFFKLAWTCIFATAKEHPNLNKIWAYGWGILAFFIAALGVLAYKCGTRWPTLQRLILEPIKALRLVCRSFILIDFISTFLMGLYAENLLDVKNNQIKIKHSAFLDDIDFRDWLKKHGASLLCIHSSLLSCIYIGANYQQGAGIGIMSTFRFLCDYQGAFSYVMQAGMGEVVIAPLYLALKKRGVHFLFFHHVTNLELSQDKRSIELVTGQIQACPKQGEYNPLILVKEIECWPHQPLFDQLCHGESLKNLTEDALTSSTTSWPHAQPFALRQGQDFDMLVLAIPIAAQKTIAQSLIKASSKYQQMIEHIQTIQSTAVQLWFNQSPKELGYKLPGTAIAAFKKPLHLWSQMSHLINKELHDSSRSVFYAAYCLGDVHTPSLNTIECEQARKTLQQQTHQFIEKDMKFFLSHPPQTNSKSLKDAYYRINADPSLRYTCPIINTQKYRLKTDASTFNHLYLAGDWIDTGFNTGSIESAVLSGIQAAAAIKNKII